MALHWPTFFTRLGSAIVFSAIMMTGLLWSNEYAFIALICLIQALCLKEYFGLVKKIEPDTPHPSWLPIVIQVMSFLWVLLQTKQFLGIRFSPILIAAPTFIVLATTLSKQTAWKAGAFALAGQMYIMVPVSLLYFMYDQSQIIPLALVLMIWMNDTMAYLSGSFIGKTPFSKISPKKTWEGTIGGAVLTIAGAAIWGYYSPYYNMTDWMALALCASVAGTAGDLLQSKLKRMAGVKDSGKIMPGHGGALDRFDSLLIATPFAFTYAYIFMEYIPVTIL